MAKSHYNIAGGSKKLSQKIFPNENQTNITDKIFEKYKDI